MNKLSTSAKSAAVAAVLAAVASASACAGDTTTRPGWRLRSRLSRNSPLRRVHRQNRRRPGAPAGMRVTSLWPRCASSLSYLARFIRRGSPVGRFGEVTSDLVRRRGAAKALSIAFEE